MTNRKNKLLFSERDKVITTDTRTPEDAPIFLFKEVRIKFPEIESITFHEMSSAFTRTYFSLRYNICTVLYEISNTIHSVLYLDKDYKEICFLSPFSYFMLNNKRQLLKNNDILEEDVLNICLFNGEVFYLKQVGKSIILFEKNAKLFEFPYQKQTKLLKIRNTLYIYIGFLYEIKQLKDTSYQLEKYNISNLEKQFFLTTDDSDIIYFYNNNHLIEFNKTLNTIVKQIEFRNLQSINWFDGDLYLADFNYLYLIKDMKIHKKCTFKTKGAVPALFRNLLITEFVTFINKELNTEGVLFSGLSEIEYSSGLSFYKNMDDCIIKNSSNNEVLAKIESYRGTIETVFDIRKRVLKLKYINNSNEEENMEFKGLNSVINIVYNQHMNISTVQYLSEHMEKSFEIKNMFLKRAIKYGDFIYCISDNSIVQIDLSSMHIQTRQSPDLWDLYVEENKIVVEFSKEKFYERGVFWGTK